MNELVQFLLMMELQAKEIDIKERQLRGSWWSDSMPPTVFQACQKLSREYLGMLKVLTPLRKLLIDLGNKIPDRNI